MPEVRPATVDDVPALIELLAAVAGEGRWLAAEPDFDREARAALVTETVRAGASGGDPYAVFVVADDAGQLIGDLNIGLRSYGVAELGMMVADGHRGQGIGSALLTAGIDWARARGAHKVGLEMWPDNTAARALYEKFGFVEEGMRRNHYRRRDGELRSAVIMGLLLE